MLLSSLRSEQAKKERMDMEGGAAVVLQPAFRMGNTFSRKVGGCDPFPISGK